MDVIYEALYIDWRDGESYGFFRELEAAKVECELHLPKDLRNQEMKWDQASEYVWVLRMGSIRFNVVARQVK